MGCLGRVEIVEGGWACAIVSKSSTEGGVGKVSRSSAVRSRGV